ncbi:hypothetical protein [Thermaerobacter composti]|uniref:Uncharacterized protein n=1 Tax=Thermaerobacter composti TaxID=554949 RepID=A0ABZ0QQN6_9FIRM|nr:hypothetical protein [Thermaerobacter composti]WPD19811.1 hypothetical protein Q5761_03900 [Thermaerobacter composti]
MKAIRLTGLTESHFPLSALAAFGLLRVCGDIETLETAKLGWEPDPEWTAVLYLPEGQDADRLVNALATYAANRLAAPEFNFAEELKRLRTDEFRGFAEQALQQTLAGTTGARITADFAAAYATERPPAGGRRTASGAGAALQPTLFHMVAGQQRFPGAIRQLLEGLGHATGRKVKPANERRRAIREALFGPWTYRDKQSSFGLDPSAERLHALRAIQPTREGTPPGVKAAIWLAIEALPLFPCYVAGGRFRVAGFDRDGTALYWPVWRDPIALDTLRSLIALGVHGGRQAAKRLRDSGAVEVFRSAREATTGHGYFTLRPATLWTERDEEAAMDVQAV